MSSQSPVSPVGERSPRSGQPSGPASGLNEVPFVSVENMMKLVHHQGLETVLSDLVLTLEEDYRRWESFEKTPRIPAHSRHGVIELMPTTDGTRYAFKYVNGHPKNARQGLQTVTAFGLLADVDTGYPVLISEMTLLTALRTAATSVLAARYLAPKDPAVMAIIGNGAQSEFQAVAFHTVLGVHTVRLYDIDPAATRKCAANLQHAGLHVVCCSSAEQAVQGAQIITTVTADKQMATILSDNMVGQGVHINAVGGDCPGKTELQREILLRSDIFVEYPEQTRVEGEIQQLPPDHPVTELWEVVTGRKTGRRDVAQTTIFDSVGFAIEDFSALRYVKAALSEAPFFEPLDMVADPDNPRDLFGMLERAKARSIGQGQSPG